MSSSLTRAAGLALLFVLACGLPPAFAINQIATSRLEQSLFSDGVVSLRYYGGQHPDQHPGEGWKDHYVLYWTDIHGNQYHLYNAADVARRLGINPEVSEFDPYKTYGVPQGTRLILTDWSFRPDSLTFEGYRWDDATGRFVQADTTATDDNTTTTGGTTTEDITNANNEPLPQPNAQDGQDVTPGIHAFVVRGIRLLLWVLVAFLTCFGCWVFGDGFMWMWRTEDPAHVRKGWKRLFWGVVLNSCALFLVAARVYLFQGADMTDLLAYKVWSSWLR